MSDNSMDLDALLRELQESEVEKTSAEVEQNDDILTKLAAAIDEIDSAIENTDHTKESNEQEDANTDDNEEVANDSGDDVLRKMAAEVLLEFDFTQKIAGGAAQAAGEAAKEAPKFVEGLKKALPYIGVGAGGAALGAGATSLYYQKKLPEEKAEAFEAGQKRIAAQVRPLIQRAYVAGYQRGRQASGGKK